MHDVGTGLADHEVVVFRAEKDVNVDVRVRSLVQHEHDASTVAHVAQHRERMLDDGVARRVELLARHHRFKGLREEISALARLTQQPVSQSDAAQQVAAAKRRRHLPSHDRLANGHD